MIVAVARQAATVCGIDHGDGVEDCDCGSVSQVITGVADVDLGDRVPAGALVCSRVRWLLVYWWRQGSGNACQIEMSGGCRGAGCWCCDGRGRQSMPSYRSKSIKVHMCIPISQAHSSSEGKPKIIYKYLFDTSCAFLGVRYRATSRCQGIMLLVVLIDLLGISYCTSSIFVIACFLC